MPWRMEWLRIPVFLPGKPHGQRSLEGYSPRGHRELDRPEATKQQQQAELWTSQLALVKNPPANAGGTRDANSIPGSGGSSGEGNDKPLQYSFLENPMDSED